MHLLIIEDDRTIAENIYEYLESRGHQCDYADCLATASTLLTRSRFDAAVLDRNLPDGDGLALARRLRAEGNAMPILILTARETLEDKLLGFESGCDDYLVKPFALQELEVRLLALGRRSEARQANPVLRHGELELNSATQEARLRGRELSLPPKALRLLGELLSQPNRVFSRRELEIAVWGHEQDSSDNLRSVLHTLRRALGEDAPTQVVNVHGLGYKLVSR
ncbi:response regulator transcription factor [Thauera sp.]|uniref:response regulator transcription factor n=1 Tax=Thauera sp. TaxID=1905334 RepID=UPI00257CDA0A|nr:response regulator transcription factor [Thauera sp.]